MWDGPWLIAALLQAVIDFVWADRCLLCKQIQPQRLDNAGGSARLADSLTAGNQLRLFKRVRLVNRPVCPACSLGFEDSLGPGVLADIAGDGAVVLPDGSRFEFSLAGRGDPVSPVPRESRRRPDIKVIAPFMINDPVLQLVHLLKFSGYRSLARLMAGAIAAAAERFAVMGDEPVVLVPVPMDRRKQRQRGYNQAESIGRELGRRLGLSLDTRLLSRIRQGEQQSKTKRRQRAANVRGAFAAEPARAAGRTVGLVDDLVTSGSTASACSAALLEAGAASVVVLCFGRAL
jgi:ComF family protein